MLLALAMTLATLSTVKPSCSWDHPGANPYTGSNVAALDHYADIPLMDRIALKHRIEAHDPDDTVSIKRDSITGRQDYEPAIRDMHFGSASVCSTVTRTGWSDKREEPGAVYCVKDHCILVPRICGNISRVSRRAAPVAALMPAAPFHPRPVYDLPLNPDLDLINADLRPVPMEQPELTELDDSPPLARGVAGLGATYRSWDWRLAPPPDDVFIAQPVPEPETWAMLVAGLALLALLQRSQRQRQRQA